EKAWPVRGDLGVFEESFVLGEVCGRAVTAPASTRGDKHSHHDQEKTDQTTKQAEHENLLRSLSVLRWRQGDESANIVPGPCCRTSNKLVTSRSPPLSCSFSAS